MVPDHVGRGCVRTTRPSTEHVHVRCEVLSHWRRAVVFLTSASKYNIEPNDGLFDVNPENGLGSPSVKNGLRGFHTEWGVSTLLDARSFFRLTKKIPPLGSMLTFDVDVKKRPHVTNVKTVLVSKP